MTPGLGPQSLVADLVRDGAPSSVKLDALAGAFDPWSFGDPTSACGMPSWLSDAVAVHAYDVAADGAIMIAALGHRAAAAPEMTAQVYSALPPTTQQRTVLGALRRLIDGGERVTHEELSAAAAVRPSILRDVLLGLVDRGLIEILPAGDFPPWIVLGPRARLYPERTPERTATVKRVEALLREGIPIAEVALRADVPPTEVARIRAVYCRDLISSTRPTGPNHARVVELARAKLPARQIAAQVGISRPRVAQIITNAKRLGDL